MNTQTVSAFRHTYGSPGLAGLEGLVDSALAATLLRYFGSYLVFDENEETPKFCYQLPPALASLVPDLIPHHVMNEVSGKTSFLDAANHFLRSSPYTVGFDNIGHSLSSLLSIYKSQSDFTGFDFSVKNGIFGATPPNSYPADLLRIEKVLFSQQSNHCNIVIPIFAMGSWIAFVYLVVTDASLWIEFLRNNIAFPLILGEQLSFCGVYELISRKDSSLKHKSALLRAVIANGGKHYSIAPSRWVISTGADTSSENQVPVILTIAGTRIELSGFGCTLIRRFEQIESDARVDSVLRASRRAAARAAVFARNFSHVAGSHVISNPEFRAALVEKGIASSRLAMDAAYRGFTKAEEAYLKDGYFSKPDDLWSEGTNVLNNVRKGLRAGGELLENTRRFHEYLQGRFDFIARAIDDTKDQPEPLFFVTDLLEGFLKQTAYLDTLVADLGLRLKEMEFRVVLQDAGSKAEFTGSFGEDEEGKRELKWVGKGEIRIRDHDIMIALPGGMISAHAFYSLLENIIRNSCKYAPLDRPSRYSLNLSLSRKAAEDYFTLRIDDSFSKDGTAKKPDPANAILKLSDEIRRGIDRDFIDDNNKPHPSGLGLLEMQACAETLCLPLEQEGNTLPYPNFTDPHNKKDRPFGWQHNLQVPLDLRPNASISYMLALNAPVLLGYVTMQEAGAGWKFSRQFEKVEDATKKGAHILIIDGDGDPQTWGKKLEELHPFLPYRLLVVCKPERNDQQSANNVMTWTGVRDEFPVHRRIRVVEDANLYTGLFTWTQQADPKAEEQRVILAYAAWLQAWKAPPQDLNKGTLADGKHHGQWHLWVGLERDERQVREAWENAMATYSDSLPAGTELDAYRLIKIGLRSFQQGEAEIKAELFSGDKPGEKKATSPFDKIELNQDDKEQKRSKEQTYWKRELAADYHHKRALVFDNHGNCFKSASDAEKTRDFRKSTRFYQKLTGSLTPDLFHTLSRPPTNPFAFAFFIHSLVEACLTNVTVVDERLAWNLLAADQQDGNLNKNFAEDLANHQKAGVFPIFSFRHKVNELPQYTEKHQALLKLAHKASCTQEGVNVDATETKASTTYRILVPLGDEQFTLLETDDPHCAACDVLIVHEGALDLLVGSGMSWKQEFAKHLYALSPAVIRTSGRGRETKHLNPSFPFIEFGEVSSAILTSRNKYSLVRGLLGAAGDEKKE